jgi:hypothetical protein
LYHSCAMIYPACVFCYTNTSESEIQALKSQKDRTFTRWIGVVGMHSTPALILIGEKESKLTVHYP